MHHIQKGIMVILDGAGDRPMPEFGGQTPLEAARTPLLDAFVTKGQCGLVDPVFPGIPVGTQTGTGIVFGLPPQLVSKLHRGPVEAAGVGMTLQPGDIAIRCNFATLEPNGRRFLIRDRRAGRIAEGTHELAVALNGVSVSDGVSAELHPATQHRAVLRLSGSDMSPAISDTDPGGGPGKSWVQESRPSRADDPGAERTAAAVNAFVEKAFEVLRDHPVNRAREARGLPPANGIITRGAGTVRHFRSFVSHMGVTAAVVAGELTAVGLAKLFSYTTITDPRFTALPNTDLDAKVQAAMAALQDHDLVFLHIKGADICSHDKNPVGKRDFLERLDTALEPLANEHLIVGLTCDHCTDTRTGGHCGDPVPSFLSSPHGRRDRCTEFGETDCAAGGLNRITGTGFLASMLDAMGAVDSYRPGDRGALFGYL